MIQREFRRLLCHEEPLSSVVMRDQHTPLVFLLSPAHSGGRRAMLLRRAGSSMPLAVRFREGRLTLGSAFAFMSGLYFRGKLTYAQAFARAHDALDAVLVITPTRGLRPPDDLVTELLLEEFAAVDVSAGEARYREPLERDAAQLASRIGQEGRVVLLGSIATGKYVDVLAAALGPRLLYPRDFVGRGDMSRGGLLLRAAASGQELDYAVLAAGPRPHGPRPPRLAPLRK